MSNREHKKQNYIKKEKLQRHYEEEQSKLQIIHGYNLNTSLSSLYNYYDEKLDQDSLLLNLSTKQGQRLYHKKRRAKERNILTTLLIYTDNDAVFDRDVKSLSWELL